MPDAEKHRLQAVLEGHYDIKADLEYLRRCASWVRDHFHDIQTIPVPQTDGKPILLRGLYLDALLMLYRRVFASGHRISLDRSKLRQVLAAWQPLHDVLMERENDVVAHSISARSSTTIKIIDGRICPSEVRPGHNKFDFENLVQMADVWLPFVNAEIARLSTELATMIEPGEDEGSDYFVAPFGSRVDMQSQRTGRPAERTRRQLAKQHASHNDD